MKSHQLAASAVLAGSLTYPFIVHAATEQQLRAASSPILVSRTASSPTRPSGRAVVTIEGKPIDFGRAPLLQAAGKLMVPLRPIGEALGAAIAYDSATGTINAERAGYKLTLSGGAYTFKGNTLVPLRVLSQSLGVKVCVANRSGLMRIALAPLHNGRAGITVISSNSNPLRPTQTGDITDANIQYNLKQLNIIRARNGAPALKLDARLSAFARQGSLELMRTHKPHGHFSKANVWKNGFEKTAAENQGDPNGWFPGPINASIDQILKAMMDEGPGGGHHDNILNPSHRRVGIGLIKDANGRLYFTNDFSG